MANAVTIQLAVRGASQAIQTLREVGSEAQSLAERVSQARTAFLAAGGATAGFAAAAIASFESAERLRRVLAATVTDGSGAKLAEQIMAVAEAASSSGEMLRRFAMNWVAMVDGGERSVVRMMRALDRLGAGLSAQQREQVAFQLAQVGSLPTVQWEDVKQLAQAGLPLKLVARQLGLSNARELAGIDSRLFVEAFARAAEAAPAQRPLPTTQLANLMEKALNSLVQTGALVAQSLEPLIDAAGRFLDWFRAANRDGKLGFTLLVGGVSATTYALGRYAAAVVRATFALESLAASAATAAGGSAASAAAKGAAGLGVPAGARSLILGGAAAMLGGMAGQTVGEGIGGQAGGMIGAVAGAAIAPTLARLAVAALSRGFSAIVPLVEKAFGRALDRFVLTVFSRALPALGGSAAAGAIAGMLGPALAGLIVAGTGLAIGTVVSEGLDQLARMAGYENVGDWLHRTLGGGGDERARAGRAANKTDAMAYGYTEEEAERIAGVVGRMRAGRALKRSDWQNFASATAAQAARSY